MIFNVNIVFVLLLENLQLLTCDDATSLPSVLETHNAVLNQKDCRDIFSFQIVADEYAYDPSSKTCYLIDSTSPASPVSVAASYCIQHYSKGNTHRDRMALLFEFSNR